MVGNIFDNNRLFGKMSPRETKLTSLLYRPPQCHNAFIVNTFTIGKFTPHHFVMYLVVHGYPIIQASK